MNGEPARRDAPGLVVLRLTRAELLDLAASVNEAIEAVEDWEFPARLGAGKAEARVLRAELGDLIARLPPGRAPRHPALAARSAATTRLKKRPGYGDIVKLAGAGQPLGAMAAFVTWKACSSMATGSCGATRVLDEHSRGNA